jgi:hypothetical protein
MELRQTISRKPMSRSDAQDRAFSISSVRPRCFVRHLAGSVRDVCTSLAEMQAWAQNLGRESLTTTFGSHAKVAPAEQGALIRNAGRKRAVRMTRSTGCWRCSAK